MAEAKLRLSKARRRAKAAIRQTQGLLSKHGARIDPASAADVQEAIAALQGACDQNDVVAIYDHLKTLDTRVTRHLGRFKKSSSREYFESIGVAIMIALALRTFVVEAFTIPSGSMIPTLAVGDFLFVNKLSYGVRIPFADTMATQWSVPEQGDVIVFVYPCNNSQDYIKRVVGLPGQTIDVTGDGFVTVDGKVVGEQPKGEFDGYDKWDVNDAPTTYAYGVTLGHQRFETLHLMSAPPSTPEGVELGVPQTWDVRPDKRICRGEQSNVQADADIPFPWKVPEGHVFVMGDNRWNSKDSRFWGFVPYGNIKGKALFIWLSWDYRKPWSRFWEKVRFGRIGHAVHNTVD